MTNPRPGYRTFKSGASQARQPPQRMVTSFVKPPDWKAAQQWVMMVTDLKGDIAAGHKEWLTRQRADSESREDSKSDTSLRATHCR